MQALPGREEVEPGGGVVHVEKRLLQVLNLDSVLQTT